MGSFGSRLCDARNAVGMYQDVAAKRMGISRATLSAIENGKRQVMAADIVRFSELYQVSPMKLLYESQQEVKKDSVLDNLQKKKEELDKPTEGQAEVFRAIRDQTGMNRKDFAEWLGIPYRTMQEWELGRRVMPDYVLKLVDYKVQNELAKGNLKKSKQINNFKQKEASR